jgi:hypothetical protein
MDRLVVLAGGRASLAGETAMSNWYARLLAAGGAAVLMAALGAPVALGAPAALAAATATTWTVQPGGAIAAAGSVTLTDANGGISDTCTSSTMSGTLKAGGGLPGSGIGLVSMAGYRGCGTLGSRDITPRGLPWHLNQVSYDAASGVSRGTISHLKLVLSVTGCHAVINGTSSSTADGVVAVSYANKTGQLKLHPHGGTLHWYHISGCAGLIHPGDTATLSATYTVSPRQDITSP